MSVTAHYGSDQGGEEGDGRTGEGEGAEVDYDSGIDRLSEGVLLSIHTAW